MEVLSGRPRVPSGEAGPPVKEARWPGAREARAGEGLREKTAPASWGVRLPRAHVRPAHPSPGPSRGPQPLRVAMASRCSRPPTPPTSAKSAIGPSPLPRWGEGKLALCFPCPSQLEFLGLFPPATEGEQDTAKIHKSPTRDLCLT
jgi:hypothetical protein